MKVELQYDQNGTINGTLIAYNKSLKPVIEENEYVIDGIGDHNVLIKWLKGHPTAKTINKKKCGLKLCVPLKQLKIKMKTNQAPTSDEIAAAKLLLNESFINNPI